MILDASTLKSYNKSRYYTDTSLACHAPSVSLNFEQNGNVRACCYNTVEILGRWPEQTIKEIWTGNNTQALRDKIAINDLGSGCTDCAKMIVGKNYQGVRAKYFDEYRSNSIFAQVERAWNGITRSPVYPRLMEFELSNECNLECVMCNGYFSSSIRKNREQLPPAISPYNEDFVNQLEEFLPHMTDAKFLGGEPFMIPIYLSIWERIKKINPDIRIHITTNGTFLNNRIKELLEGLKVGFIISIDSVKKDTYEKIRVNGHYERVMENMAYFKSYTLRKKTFLSMTVCPMTVNWRELPEMTNYCINNGIVIHFNTVFQPRELSLSAMSEASLREVIGILSSSPIVRTRESMTDASVLSLRAYMDHINLLRSWLAEKVCA